VENDNEYYASHCYCDDCSGVYADNEEEPEEDE